MSPKQILSIVPLLCCILSAQFLCAQQPKPPQNAKPAVKILHDEDRNFYAIANKETDAIIKVLLYQEVFDFKEGLAQVISDKGIGYINEQGKEIVAPDGKYTFGADFSQGMAVVGTLDESGEVKSAGYINKTGALVVPLIYQNARTFSENMAAVKKNGKWGYINKTGTLVIACQFKDAQKFKCGVAGVCKEITLEEEINTLWGYIDKTGKQIIPFKYESAGNFRETSPGKYHTHILRGNTIYIIDKKGKELERFGGLDDDEFIVRMEWAWDDSDELLIKTEKVYYAIQYYGIYSLGMNGFLINTDYYEIQPRKEPTSGTRFYAVQGSYFMDFKIGLVKTKNCQIPAVYDHIEFQSGLVYALTNVEIKDEKIAGGDFELYDLDLKLLTKNKYGWITPFTGEYAYVLQNGLYGLINRRGEEVIPPIYEGTGVLQSGVIPVLKEGKVGLINTNGTIIAPFEYQGIGNFYGGYATYTQDNRFGIMDSTGRRVTEPQFEELGDFSHGLSFYMENNRLGFVNTKGEVVIPAEYQDGNAFSEGLALVMKDDKVGFIDPSGKVVIPLIYQKGADFKNGYALVQENDTIHLINKQGTIIKTY